MLFEWDPAKNQSNLKKHSISFEEASQIFSGNVLSWVETRKDYDEIREISIGTLGKAVVIIVVHTDRNGKIRIISARKANRTERKMYDEHIQKTS